MKKHIQMAALVLCATGIYLQAQATITVKGKAKYKNKTFTEPLIVTGRLSARGLKAPSIEVHNRAKLEDSTIGTATIKGKLDADNTVFTGPVTAVNKVTAEESTFNGALTVTGDKTVYVELEDTQANTITINTEAPVVQDVEMTGPGIGFVASFKYTTREQDGPLVELKGNTVVQGDIQFIGEPGTVVLEGKAKHLGTIIGGK